MTKWTHWADFMQPGMLAQIATKTGLSQDTLNAALWRHADVNGQKGYEMQAQEWRIFVWQENGKLDWGCAHVLQAESQGEN